MYIIADVEWAQNKANKNSPTQLAAVRVDSNWDVIDDFHAYIRPLNSSFYDWNHIAYTGGTPSDFMNASNCYNVFSSFNKWIGEDTVCWWSDQSASIHSLVNNVFLKGVPIKKPIILTEYMRGFLDGQEDAKNNQYKLARARGIPVPSPEHDSQNDVMAILCLFKGLNFSQKNLLSPPLKPSKPTNNTANLLLDYLYDTQRNLLHKKGCNLIPQNTPLCGFATLNTPIKEKYATCSCVCDEFRLAKRKKITDEIQRTQYTYIYAKNSKVFHRYNCGLLYSADKIIGAIKYETVMRKGLRPCKMCNPSPHDSPRIPVTNPKADATVATPPKNRGLKRSELNAIARLEQSQKERFSHLNRTDMSKQEKNDLYTFTQPRFAFFVATGYQNFHTRNCSRLKGLSNIIGFDTFLHATHAGFTPCRQCKPTKKQDIVESIPIGNKIRESESVDDLNDLCKLYGYEHNISKNDFEVTTPVGKWKINTDVRPVTLEHINLAQNPGCDIYHKQHRIFLSMLDALMYIHKHDSSIIDSKNPHLNFSSLHYNFTKI